MKKRIGLVAVLVCLCTFMLASVSSTLAILVDRTETVVNTFVPRDGLFEEKIFVQVVAHKTVESTGSASIGPGGFRFVLKNVETGEEHTGVSDAQGLATIPLGFSEMQIGQTFVYELREIDDGRIGVDYSEKVYTVEIAVTDEAATVRIPDAESGRAEFRNIYNPGSEPVPPSTGDSGDPVLWLVLAAGCMLGMASLVRGCRTADPQKGGRA